MSEELERRMASDDIEIRQPYGVIWVDEGRGLHIPFPKATIPVIGLLCVSTLLLGYESLKIPINSATGEIVSKTDQIDRNGALALLIIRFKTLLELIIFLGLDLLLMGEILQR